jgi:hypothetical protein
VCGAAGEGGRPRRTEVRAHGLHATQESPAAFAWITLALAPRQCARGHFLQHAVGQG